MAASEAQHTWLPSLKLLVRGLLQAHSYSYSLEISLPWKGGGVRKRIIVTSERKQLPKKRVLAHGDPGIKPQKDQQVTELQRRLKHSQKKGKMTKTKEQSIDYISWMP